MKMSFEGTSFAGKTTSAKELESYRPERYKLIEEYVVYAGGSKNFPPYPPKDKKEALSNLEFFLNLERKRHEDIERIKSDGSVVVMDRSVVSLLGFRYAQKYLAGIDIFVEARDIIKNEPYLAPDFIFYLAVSDKGIQKRLQDSQRPVGELFIDKDFNGHIRKFFDWLQDQKEYPIIRIDTERDPEEVRNEIRAIADNLPTDDVQKLNKGDHDQ